MFVRLKFNYFLTIPYFLGSYNIKNITNMASRLKQSNLTALSSTQKKTQEKSLE